MFYLASGDDSLKDYPLLLLPFYAAVAIFNDGHFWFQIAKISNDIIKINDKLSIGFLEPLSDTIQVNAIGPEQPPRLATYSTTK